MKLDARTICVSRICSVVFHFATECDFASPWGVVCHEGAGRVEEEASVSLSRSKPHRRGKLIKGLRGSTRHTLTGKKGFPIADFSIIERGASNYNFLARSLARFSPSLFSFSPLLRFVAVSCRVFFPPLQPIVYVKFISLPHSLKVGNNRKLIDSSAYDASGNS